MSALWAVEIEKTQPAGFPSEPLDTAIEHADRVAVDCKDSPGNASCLVPNFHPKPTGPEFKRVLARREARNFLAILDHRGTAARRQKCLDSRKQGVGIERLREFG
ncbi:MAG: hypothetical protein ACR2JB_28510 [Bryobacteraceae bacterium]